MVSLAAVTARCATDRAASVRCPRPGNARLAFSLFDLGAGEFHEFAPALALVGDERAELLRRAGFGDRAEAVERGLGLGRLETGRQCGVELAKDRLGRAE